MFAEFEWRAESASDSVIGMMVRAGATIELWALNTAALQFVADFAAAYGEPLQLLDSSHGVPVPILGTESAEEILKRILALDA